MIAHTHRLVGEFLYNQLSQELQALLHRRNFVYGNVKPDIIRKYRKMSHYYRDNCDMIFSMLEDLLETAYSTKTFSEKLGILIHFFCDYTCVYHANEYIYEAHTIRHHMQYETKLHFYTVRQLRDSQAVTIIPFQSTDDIYNYVKQLITDVNHHSKRVSIEFDFNQMIQLSLSITLYVLNYVSKASVNQQSFDCL